MRDDISTDLKFIKKLVAAIGTFSSCMLHDINDHCDRWCMNTGECPPACPLYKYLEVCNRFEVRQK